ncbi:condensation domain-containing protein [Nonomuraea typhae]|uniref:Condensation domain-containing protein n=1 Tax=Nonomuraea typhae TaxID=2603600 RepID=A0ABW7Z4A2_9ACTN
MRSEPTIPLTPAQRRLWALAQLRPGDPYAAAPFAVELRGPLDAALLGRCLNEIVRRHAPLRAGIRLLGGELVQLIRPATPYELEVSDLSALSALERARRAQELTAALTRRPFDLAGEPLWRMLLLRLGEERHRLVVAVHRIVFDGPSLQIFMDELLSLYGGRPLPELAEEYCSQPHPQAAAYWSDRLRGAPAAMDLPLAGPRPAWSEQRAARVSRWIPPGVLAPLRELARRQRATMSTVLKAAWDVVLRQHGAGDVLVGASLPGRRTVAAGRLIGCFAQPVVLRSDLSGRAGLAMAFTELLAAVRREVLDAHTYGELPYEQVLRELKVTCEPGCRPFFQVMFAHLPPEPEGRAGGVAFAAANLRLETTPADLEITLADAEHGAVQAHLDYRLELLEEHTAERMLARMAGVLERIGRDPAARLSHLVLPDAAETDQVLRQWNATRAPYPAERCVHHLVTQQAARTPERVAVRAGTHAWTYRELEEAANRIGHHLRALGVTPETQVGLCLPYSPQMPAALLGILKAGGVCVPLDTPGQEHAPAIILAGPRHAPPPPGRRLVALEEAACRPSGPVQAPVTAANAACILSAPGVVLEHRNLTNLLTWAHRELGEKALAGVPLTGPLNSGAAMFAIFTTLTCGGTVLIADDGPARIPGAATVVVAAPSAHAALLNDDALPESAPIVISNGEPLPPPLLEQLYARESVDVVYNLYACTETSLFSLFTILAPGEPITIGRPVDNTTAYVLDPLLRPVPPGVAGLLYLGGAAVSRGYLGRPALTAERFIADPFSAEPGRRLYATGDLVRHRPDGRLQFLGRAGHQVRLRGCRVELSEVEAAILEHPAVAGACAMLTREQGADVLVAAVVPRPGTRTPAQEIRADLRRRLPAAMVPARLVLAPHLPLLPSGRLDRAQILLSYGGPPSPPPDPPSGLPACGLPACGPAETAVSAAWAEILGHAAGVNENFFDAGGTSLSLVMLGERLRRDFGADVHAGDLLRHPTVREMAALLTGAARPARPQAPPRPAAKAQPRRRER